MQNQQRTRQQQTKQQNNPSRPKIPHDFPNHQQNRSDYYSRNVLPFHQVFLGLSSFLQFRFRILLEEFQGFFILSFAQDFDVFLRIIAEFPFFIHLEKSEFLKNNLSFLIAVQIAVFNVMLVRPQLRNALVVLSESLIELFLQEL